MKDPRAAFHLTVLSRDVRSRAVKLEKERERENLHRIVVALREPRCTRCPACRMPDPPASINSSSARRDRPMMDSDYGVDASAAVMRSSGKNIGFGLGRDSSSPSLTSKAENPTRA